MVTGSFDTDGDGNKDIIIKGGALALIAILIVADLMITGGQFTQGLLDRVIATIPN